MSLLRTAGGLLGRSWAIAHGELCAPSRAATAGRQHTVVVPPFFRGCLQRTALECRPATHEIAPVPRAPSASVAHGGRLLQRTVASFGGFLFWVFRLCWRSALPTDVPTRVHPLVQHAHDLDKARMHRLVDEHMYWARHPRFSALIATVPNVKAAYARSQLVAIAGQGPSGLVAWEDLPIGRLEYSAGGHAGITASTD